MTMTATERDIVRIQGNMVLIPEFEYEKMREAWENEQYRKKIEQSMEQSRQGKVIIKSLEELETMESE